MKLYDGVWIPDGELVMTAKQSFCERYDERRIACAVAACTGLRRAVDVGGHVGLWSRELVKIFNEVHAFEPVEEHRNCFVKNVPAGKFVLHPCALGDHEHQRAMVFPRGSSMKSHLSKDGTGIVIRTLDSFELQDVDLLKVDCEGYDYLVLMGALLTIARSRPVIVFEAKSDVSLRRFGLNPAEPVQLMAKLGYEKLSEENGNYVYLSAG